MATLKGGCEGIVATKDELHCSSFKYLQKTDSEMSAATSRILICLAVVEVFSHLISLRADQCGYSTRQASWSSAEPWHEVLLIALK